LNLLNLRAQKVKEIAELKKEKKKPFFDPSREKKIIEKLIKKNKGPLSSKDVELIMDTILKVYRAMFKPFKISYLGPEGTFTHQAALKKFGEKGIYIPCRTIDDVFREVEKGRVDYGVVPIENSMEGVITHTLDMFLESELKITSEILLEIHHYLLSKEKSLKDIKKIYSHPQALAQCRKWIAENLPNVEIIETESTAGAVKKVKTKRKTAAIGSEVAAKIYNLSIIAEKIEDFSENITRFLVIGKEFTERTGHDKTSILFSIKDKVGALHDMLVPFKEEKINLTRIESRPSKRKAWEYVFFVDFTGHKDEKRVKRALEKLEKTSVFLKILGSYPKEGG
ncbi:prephenate dehydratase, partial [bacterium]|nr:prephenate dehydratase [bacterium]